MADFDIQPTLVGARLSLRPMTAADRDGLYDAARDPAIWAQHPARTRHQREVFDPYFDFLLGAGGTLIARDVAQDTIIGCSRYYAAPDQPRDWAIGFTFLAAAYWGGSWNRDMKSLMLDHAYQSVQHVWFHIAPDNTRSQIATTRLGATFEYEADLELGGAIVPTKCYLLRKTDWATIRS